MTQLAPTQDTQIDAGGDHMALLRGLMDWCEPGVDYAARKREVWDAHGEGSGGAAAEIAVPEHFYARIESAEDMPDGYAGPKWGEGHLGPMLVSPG